MRGSEDNLYEESGEQGARLGLGDLGKNSTEHLLGVGTAPGPEGRRASKVTVSFQEDRGHIRTRG